MKRSFYEVLGVARDADQSQIDTAYAAAGAKLMATSVRGIAAATAERAGTCWPLRRRTGRWASRFCRTAGRRWRRPSQWWQRSGPATSST